MLYVQKIKPEFKDKKNHVKKELKYRFLYRNYYTFRRPSHVGQLLPTNYSELFINSQKKVILSKKI